MNRVTLVGRLTAKPELRQTQSDIAYAKFTLAVNRQFKKDEADFINCVAWKKQAETISQYLDKGSLISLDGRIQTNSYTDKEGKKRVSFDVVVDSVEFLSKKETKEVKEEEKEHDPYQFMGEQLDDEDLD
jgi:single-strand DNA-binding protein